MPFIQVFRKMAEQYCPNKIELCKDAVSIPGISMTYVLNKSSKKNPKSFSYIHLEAFVTDVEMNKRSYSTVVVTVP